jgi:DNA-binding transcriptional LysR family regulator
MARPNARQIEAFRALMLSSSTVRAAELMHVTQPAVSRLIRELQATLSLKLFDRVGNRLRPTSDAVALYAEVERSFVGLEKIGETARELGTRRAGKLRIAAMPALCNGALPRFVAEFTALHPRLDIEIYGLASQSVIDWVVSDQCDLGFAAAPVEHGAIEVSALPAVRYVAAIPEKHRLARQPSVRARDFHGESFIALGDTTRSRFRIDDIFAKHGVVPAVRVKTPLSAIACALVAGGVGCAVVDPFTAREFTSRGVAVKRFQPAADFQVAALHTKRRTPGAVEAEFVDGFSRYVARLQKESL